MRLEEYLEAIRSCPDELLENRQDQPLWRLTAELGIYDNRKFTKPPINNFS